MNVVMVEGGGFIEIQGTAEAAPFDDETLDAMLGLAKTGIAALFREQRHALGLAS
jgi:ribonuclease PH